MANINDKTSKLISKLCDELKSPANKKYLQIIKKNLTLAEEEIDILGKLRAIQKDITYIKKEETQNRAVVKSDADIVLRIQQIF